jgi:Short C-terminal domain
MMRRRRPLLRGAMVGGVGYMAGKAGANRAAQEASQEQRIAGMESQQAAGGGGGSSQPSQPAAPAGGGTIEQLKQLGELRDSGVLTPEEFEREKQKLLGGGS